jgi:hypothetical protein
VDIEWSGVPWGHPDSVILIALRHGARADETLPQRGTFIGFRPVSIGPGKPACGDVDLDTRFPTLAAEIKKGHDVIVFWYYSVPLDDGAAWEAGGYVRIKGHASAKPHAPAH